MAFRPHLVPVLAAAFGLAVVTTTVTLPASAQDQEAISQARAKFQRALELKQAGDFGGAVKLFREVGQVKMTPQVRYHIASCEEELGKLVAALGGYEIALEQSAGMHPDFVADVEESVNDLRARIPKVVIERGDGADAATIELDGVALGAKRIGVEIPLDPGPHTITATAPGHEDYSETVTVNEQSIETVVLELTPMSKKRAAAVAGDDEVDETPKGYGAWPFVIGGAGVAVAGMGAILLPISQGKASEAETICGGTNCDALGDTDPDAWREAKSLADQATTLETVGWISVGVGAAAIGTGVVLFLIDPTRTGEKPDAKGDVALSKGEVDVAFRPNALGAEAGFSLVGTF